MPRSGQLYCLIFLKSLVQLFTAEYVHFKICAADPQKQQTTLTVCLFDDNWLNISNQRQPNDGNGCGIFSIFVPNYIFKTLKIGSYSVTFLTMSMSKISIVHVLYSLSMRYALKNMKISDFPVRLKPNRTVTGTLPLGQYLTILDKVPEKNSEILPLCSILV